MTKAAETGGLGYQGLGEKPVHGAQKSQGYVQSRIEELRDEARQAMFQSERELLRTQNEEGAVVMNREAEI